MDQEEELKQKWIDSEYKYLEYIKSKWSEKFVEETKNHEFDRENIYYTFFFTKQEIEPYEIDNKTKILYKELVLLFHPDRCKEEWSNDLFLNIQEAYERNDIKKLEEIKNYWDEHKSFKYFFSVQGISLSENTLPQGVSKEEQIKQWRSQMWYVWYANNEYTSMLKSMFKPFE